MTKELTTLSPLAEDVFEGLKAKGKHLPSKYFYDSKGDELFQERYLQLEENWANAQE